MAATAMFAISSTAFIPPVITTVRASPFSVFPILPPRSSFSTASLKQLSESGRTSLFQVRASEDSTSPIDSSEFLTDLKEKWDGIENKTTVLLYGGGAILAIWLSAAVVSAINSVPLLPKLMELVGLGYTGWFIYRYLLFKSSRKELATDIEALKKKITGTDSAE